MSRLAAPVVQPAHVHRARLPLWLRWVAGIWLVFWFATYWKAWGLENFLHLCDIAVILACLGIIFENRLLIASQAVSAIVVDVIWDVEVSWTAVSGHHLISGTEYMWDAHHALWVRLLSLYHVVWPVLLVWLVARVRYDKRALALQAAIAAAAIIASRFADPAQNLNYAFRDPFLHRQWGPAPAHLALTWFAVFIVAYVPAHIALARLFPLSHGKECRPEQRVRSEPAH